MELDLFIEKFSSFIIDNILSDIRTFTGSNKIIIEFHQNHSLKVEKISDYEVYDTEIEGLYTKNQFNILKEFHNDIGNYLIKNLTGSRLTWNVIVYKKYITVEITYNIDYNAIKMFSKKLDD